jgi:alpha/beta superfamily hydrolase
MGRDFHRSAWNHNHQPPSHTLRLPVSFLPGLDSLSVFIFGMPANHESRNFFLSGPAGRLEAVFWAPVQSGPPPLAAVVCHPHPVFGGTLHNKVVYQAAKSLDALGLPVLRFNFRGAGRSQGKHDRGEGELGDVRAALNFLSREYPGVPLLLAGFSFGCWVGLRVGCQDSRVDSLIGMGTPLNNSDFSFLHSCSKPKLFVQGSRDEHGDAEKLRGLVESLPGEKRLVVVPEADHFFAGKLGHLGSAISSWLKLRYPHLA